MKLTLPELLGSLPTYLASSLSQKPESQEEPSEEAASPSPPYQDCLSSRSNLAKSMESLTPPAAPPVVAEQGSQKMKYSRWSKVQ